MTVKEWSETHKPRSSSRFQTLLAGGMWSAVGTGLLTVGLYWTVTHNPGAVSVPLIVAGVAIGLAKSKLVLDKTAGKIVKRISERGEGRCIGGFLSVRSWILILLMILAGRVLRGSGVPVALVGALYVAVGTGLLFSSRLAWQAWRAAGTGRQ